jgi:hypothetical protein
MGGVRRKSVLPGKNDMQMAGDKMGEIAEIRSRALQKTAAVYEKRRMTMGKVMAQEAKELRKIEIQLADFERQHDALAARLGDRVRRRGLLREELGMAEAKLHEVVERSHEEYLSCRHQLTAFQSRQAIESNLAARGYSMGSRGRGSSKRRGGDAEASTPKASHDRQPAAPPSFRPKSAQRPGTANRIIATKTPEKTKRPNTSGGRVLGGKGGFDRIA